MKIIENFFVLEGLDASGKSTVRDILKKSGYRVCKTPPDNFPISREKYDNLDVRIRFLFYIFGVIQINGQISKDRKKGITICDRYLLSTLTYHEAMGLSEKLIMMVIPFLKFINTPNKTFLLVVDEQERLRRLTERGANDNDIANLKINEKVLAGFRKWSKKLGHSLTEINTSHKTPEQVANLIEEMISPEI